MAPVLKNEDLLATYDMWLELEVIGVPYAANEEIIGGDGRSDVFYGSLTLDSDRTRPAEDFDLLLPLAMKDAFNNYADHARECVY